MLLVVRGKRFHAAGIGFLEATVYIMALGYVVERLSDPISIIVYGLGFATGNVVGSLIEERMALGFVTVQVITLVEPSKLSEALREAGFGVTIIEGCGREGIHPILHIILPRKRFKELQGMVEQWDEKAFVTVLETKSTLGGVGMVAAKQKAK